MKKLLFLALLLLFAGCKIELEKPKITLEKVENEDGIKLMFYCDSVPMLKEWLFIPFPETTIVHMVYDTTIVVPQDYRVEIDSFLNCEKRIIQKPVYLFKWVHDFKDIEGNYEELLYFKVGMDIFKTRDDLIHWRPRKSVYFGNIYSQTAFSEYKSGRNYWEYTCSGIPVGEYVVLSVQAIDRAGNPSDWMRSINDSLCQPPFYIWREK